MRELSATQPAVRCRGLTRVYHTDSSEVWALRGVDLDLWRGELTLLAGPSGCGKTTLLSILTGILSPTAGDVLALGESLTALTDNARTCFRRRNVGFVFQQYHLLPSLSIGENVALPLTIAGISHRRAQAAAVDVLRQVGLPGVADDYPSRLSGGQQQRVAIARSLVHQPRLLVCDEPTAALDAQAGRQIMDLLKQIASDARRAVLVVTHDPRVFEFGDRIAQMDDGRIDRVEVTSAAPALT